MKRVLLIALTVLTLHLPALAQDATPTPEQTPIVTETPAPVEPTEPAEPIPGTTIVPVIPVEDAGALLLAAIASIIGGAVLNAPITVFIVAIAKRLDKNQVVTGGVWQLIVGGAVTVTIWIARRYGFEGQANEAFNFIVIAGPALLNLLTTFVGSSALYKTAAKTDTPLVGYQRPLKAA